MLWSAVFGSAPASSNKAVVNFLLSQVVSALISSTLSFSAFCFLLILVRSQQCDTFSSVLAVLHKLLCLNKTRWKLPTCQADCKVVFSWTRTSTHLMLFFPFKRYYCSVMAGQASDVHSTRQQLKLPALCQQMNVNQQWKQAFKDKDLSLCGHL